MLKVFHDLGKFYLIHSKNSKSTQAISKYYYRRYFNLLKTVSLNEKERKIADNNKLNQLLYTQNDSIFHYLEAFKIDNNTKADYLNHWHRELGNHKKELSYANESGNKIDIIVALKNNKDFEAVETLFPKYRDEFIKNDKLSEHKLYLIMGQYYLNQKRYFKSEVMYLKALTYFSSTAFNLYIETILNDLIKIQSENGNFTKYRFYINKLIAQNKAKEEQQLKIHVNHLDYSAYIRVFELHLKNE